MTQSNHSGVYFKTLKSGIKEFKTTLNNLKQLQDCVEKWIKPEIKYIVITNKNNIQPTTYHIKISQKNLLLSLQSTHSSHHYTFNFKNGVLKKNGEVHTLENIRLLNQYVQHAIHDLTKHKAIIYQKENES